MKPAVAVPISERVGAGLMAAVLMLVLAPVVLSDFQLTVFAAGVGFAVAAAGVAVAFASTGMLALTQPAMMLIGGYVALHLVQSWHWPYLAAVPAATAAGMVVAIPLGWLTCRLDRFSFAVLGFAFTYLIAMLLSSNILSGVTGGELGKPVPPPVLLGNALHAAQTYSLVAVIAVLAFAAAALIFRSSFGRVLLILRQDDVVAHSLGVNGSLYRISLTAIVSGFGALGGVLATQAIGYIAPPHFDVALSVVLLAMALVGGASYLAGPLVGAVALHVVPALLDLKQVDRDLLAGTILLVCLVVLPTGVLGLARAFRRKKTVS